MDQSVGFVERAVADTKKAAKYQQEARRVSSWWLSARPVPLFHPSLKTLRTVSKPYDVTHTQTNSVINSNPDTPWNFLLQDFSVFQVMKWTLSHVVILHFILMDSWQWNIWHITNTFIVEKICVETWGQTASCSASESLPWLHVLACQFWPFLPLLLIQIV